MEQTLQALSGILLKALVTVFFVVLLHFYLKGMLFGPLARILKEREALTEGAKKSAATSLAEAEHKTAEYEVKLREARAEVYREQEAMRRQWLDEQAKQVAEARAASEVRVRAAKAEIAAEAAAARNNLSGTAATLADQIAGSILAGKGTGA
jgi:F-type H+-transporting ATPase subunit b